MSQPITLVVDDKALNNALDRLVKTLKDTKTVMSGVGQEMQMDIQDHFRRQTGPMERWIPSKRALGQGTGKGKIRTGTTLRDTNRMFNSLMADRAKKTGNGFASVGINSVYAAIHNFGGKIKVPEIRATNKKALHFVIGGKDVFAKSVKAHTVNMPQREFMWISPNGIKAIIARFEEAIEKAWNK